MHYAWSIEGTDADKQKWITSGVIEEKEAGHFARVPNMAIETTFVRLTDGLAVYEHPGLACNGPYKITDMAVHLVD